MSSVNARTVVEALPLIRGKQKYYLTRVDLQSLFNSLVLQGTSGGSSSESNSTSSSRIQDPSNPFFQPALEDYDNNMLV